MVSNRIEVARAILNLNSALVSAKYSGNLYPACERVTDQLKLFCQSSARSGTIRTYGGVEYAYRRDLICRYVINKWWDIIHLSENARESHE